MWLPSQATCHVTRHTLARWLSLGLELFAQEARLIAKPWPAKSSPSYSLSAAFTRTNVAKKRLKVSPRRQTGDGHIMTRSHRTGSASVDCCLWQRGERVLSYRQTLCQLTDERNRKICDTPLRLPHLQIPKSSGSPITLSSLSHTKQPDRTER